MSPTNTILVPPMTDQSTKTAAVIRSVVNGLQSGKLNLGDRLVETRLADDVGVGIGPVREALRIMAGTGIVELAPNRGARIADLSTDDVSDALSVFVVLVGLATEGSTNQSHVRRTLGNAQRLSKEMARIGATPAEVGAPFISFLIGCTSISNNEYLIRTASNLTPALLAGRLRTSVWDDEQRSRIGSVVSCVVQAIKVGDVSKLASHLDQIVNLWLPASTREIDPSVRASGSRSSGANPNTATDNVIRYVFDSIRKNSIVPGQRLIESDLVAETGEGRTPVRQALRVLAGDNVIELTANRGARVRKLTRSDLKNILEILKSVSTLGIRLLKNELYKPRFESAVKKAFSKAETASIERNPNKFMMSLVDYHRVLNEISGNRYVNGVFDILHTEFFVRELSASLTIQQWDRYVARYQAITERLISGDLQGAEDEFVDHVRDLLALLTSRAEELIY